MAEKLYTLRLTRSQLWALQQCYEASFTAPETRDKTENQVADKLDRLMRKANEDRRRARAAAGEPLVQLP